MFYQTFLRGREPDYALFLNDADLDDALQAGRTTAGFWEFPRIVADAKAWHVGLDRPSFVNNRREYPPEQIEWYLNSSHCPFGILTNGRLWRLVPRELALDQPRFETYLECDLPRLLSSWEEHDDLFARERVFDDFLRFFLFFAPVGHATVEHRQPLVDRAIHGSSEYRLGVGEDVKERVFEALQLSIDGFLRHPANDLDAVKDLEACRENGFVLLYRLLFILYAEDRGLLPYNINNLYTETRSLGRKRSEIATILDTPDTRRRDDFGRANTTLWQELQVLFDLIDTGHRRYGVPPYNGGLFDNVRHAFLAENVVPDWWLARVIDQMSRARDTAHPERGLFPVDYRDLRIQHLGSIYEGLLELYPQVATQNVKEISSRSAHAWRVIAVDQAPPSGYEETGRRFGRGDIYLATDRGERRSTGSYYTPNHIVDYLVQSTLKPVCERINSELCEEIEAKEAAKEAAEEEERPRYEAELRSLFSGFAARVLKLRVLDPAMGSGHFLLRACQYLAEEIIANAFSGEPVGTVTGDEESTLTVWKRSVVEHCIYGVDANALGVELAKLALWLETVAKDQPLTYLDHHLRVGNSLVGTPLSEMNHIPGEPPLLRDAVEQQVEEFLPTLLEPLAEIETLPSDTTEQVKTKERLLRLLVKRREAARTLADLWCGVQFLPAEAGIPVEQYNSVAQLLGRPQELRRTTAETTIRAGLDCARSRDVQSFHWELEFPEVFFAGATRRRDHGFDVVVGNPPYDVLSELETGRHLAPFKRFLGSVRSLSDREDRSPYVASMRGKNNLYKLFICRSLELLRHGGRLGLITPMAILGDDQAAGVRRLIFAEGAFTGVESFPQKDDPSRRVFREAKLATAAFHMLKTTDPEKKRARFRSRVHPAQYIDDASPSLLVSTRELGVYDPENLAVVSCDQADWDLVVQITGNPRVGRVRQFAKFFQGEVNETNERRRGVLGRTAWVSSS